VSRLSLCCRRNSATDVCKRTRLGDGIGPLSPSSPFLGSIQRVEHSRLHPYQDRYLAWLSLLYQRSGRPRLRSESRQHDTYSGASTARYSVARPPHLSHRGVRLLLTLALVRNLPTKTHRCCRSRALIGGFCSRVQLHTFCTAEKCAQSP